MTILGFDRRDLAMLKNLFFMSLRDRYLGSALGLTWAIISPLMLMGVFVFVFSFVFPGRIPGKDGTLPFVLWLISGYGPWLAISEGLNSATNSVSGNGGLVKNIAFKSELLPIVGALLGSVPLIVSFIILTVLSTIGGNNPGLALVFVAFATLLMLVFVSGIGMFLASTNVFVRDIGFALPNILMLFLFASPIFYPISAYPSPLNLILVFNPFYILVECFRAPIMDGTTPPLWMIAYITIVSVVLFSAGLWWFRRLRSFFDTRL